MAALRAVCWVEHWVAPKAAMKVISRAEPLVDWKAGNLEQRKVVQWAELTAGK